jgi:putative CocE/NonD family hydrolase
VILVVSPYLGAASPDEAPGPNRRFYDFYEGANVFAKGYSVVQVATRGTGGSTGCLDILGPGEQTDIRTAVEYARAAKWSTGHVGMYGKSYDANLGTGAAALAPKGLDAVVAQQTVPDRYRGSYNDRVRFLQSLAYPRDQPRRLQAGRSVHGPRGNHHRRHRPGLPAPSQR